jgi:Reverse transcriptase (RNA-dependent DNA polymerase)
LDIISLEPHHTDIPWVPVTNGEVHQVIFKAVSFNAPGLSELCGHAYKLTWQVAQCKLMSIVQSSIQIGYHPHLFHSALVVTLRKLNKPDYTQPRAYRLIQLLKVLGKVIECIVSNRLSHLASTHELLPPTQFGRMKGRSADDITLVTMHDIEAALNHKLVATSLTFNITGFFDFVSHPHLLATLWDKGIPLPLIKWISSFLTDRCTSLLLDGHCDKMQATKTGIPQGSCVSPILAVFFSAPLPLINSINAATSEEMFPQCLRHRI